MMNPDHLPFRYRWPVLAGALAGIVLRLLFSGAAGSSWSAMAGAFVFLAPIVVGMVTVYIAERDERRSWAYYVGAPFLATGLFVTGTLLINVEGLICVLVIAPLFGVLGSVGGLLMGVACRVTGWPRPTLYAAGVLPLLMGTLVPGTTLQDDRSQIERSLWIAAPPAVVWQQLTQTPDIRADEVERGWAYRIGVPPPQSGVTEAAGQRVQHFRMGKGIHFEGDITEWQPARRIAWAYRFAADSVPSGALDDHVRIGGLYFDLLDTAFELQPENGGTRLAMRTRYRVSTQFNFYANGVARLLLGNVSEVLLELYARRSMAGSVLHGSVLQLDRAARHVALEVADRDRGGAVRVAVDPAERRIGERGLDLDRAGADLDRLAVAFAVFDLADDLGFLGHGVPP